MRNSSKDPSLDSESREHGTRHLPLSSATLAVKRRMGAYLICRHGVVWVEEAGSLVPEARPSMVGAPLEIGRDGLSCFAYGTWGLYLPRATEENTSSTNRKKSVRLHSGT
jgi:hypothetical protein